ncbi:G-type lectin S-receptor-like serine/threonine-protein kinase RKS1 [Heracleum sosnowskyi]|uniref:G-type lectin S-receptor-like serine/threonine-protein kinase RKS1 n=1 Tax=Heracleum sosnowskyi TaxID=360622 RepID=A0AAD8HK98_9APIA|nr:G-type lectin S-receptor-like serine/threonine-protein kinase RKS1 [Heracleum sosnowskyi]
MSASYLAEKWRYKVRFIIIPTVLIMTMMLGVCLWTIRKKKKNAKAKAINGFSTNFKLGEGGFGSVYKGVLDEGKEIAVKRLSKDSRQGLKEFKNEVSCIAQLQHRNLVKLLGCSVQEGERLLVHEYMLNKSLDSFIFDKNQRKGLDWHRRYDIIYMASQGDKNVEKLKLEQTQLEQLEDMVTCPLRASSSPSSNCVKTTTMVPR